MARTMQTARKSTGAAPKKRRSDKIAEKPRKVTTGGGKKPYRFRPGTVALREIRRYQKSTKLLLLKAPFRRLMKELTQALMSDLYYRNDALDAVQEAAEAYLVKMFADANKLAVKSKRVTIKPEDIRMVLELRGPQEQ